MILIYKALRMFHSKIYFYFFEVNSQNIFVLSPSILFKFTSKLLSFEQEM